MQKYFTPSTTKPSPAARSVVSIRKVRDRLTAGSLPQEPNMRPGPTTSAK